MVSDVGYGARGTVTNDQEETDDDDDDDGEEEFVL